jgi:hypothetical protein
MAVADLAASARQNVAWLLVVEGWPYMFTDRTALAGSGASSWIGEDHGARIVKPGLKLPSSLEDALVLDGPQAGLLEQSSATFEVIDVDGVMLTLACPTDDVVYTAARLSPRDDPAPATILSMGGEDADIWGHYLNAEAIGPAGERRYWGGIPGATTPGMDHAAVDVLTGYLAAVELTATPRWREGMRVFLYLLRRDPHGQNPTEHLNWPSWQDQYDSGKALVWWGTLRKGGAKGRTWSLPCRGRDSWLRKLLNVNCPASWSKLDTQELELEDGENLFALAFQGRDGDGAVYEMGVSLFDPANDDFPAQGSPQLFLSALAARVAAVKAMAGTWTFSDYFDAWVDNDGFHLVVFDTGGIGTVTAGAVVIVIMHEKIWRYLGYDVEAQSTFPLLENETQIFFQKQTKQPVEINGASANLPATGSFYRATFTTKKLGTEVMAWTFEPGDDITNSYAIRTFRPLTPGGVLVLKAAGMQEVGDGAGTDARYIEGQLARPVADYLQNGTTQVDQTRWFLFRGSRRMDIADDPVDFYAVAKVSWADQDGFFMEDPVSIQRQFVIERWLDPRYYGYPFRPLDFDWASAAGGKEGIVEYVPLAALTWADGIDGPDESEKQRANTIVTRLLVSSGTAEWLGYDGQQGASQSAGFNGFSAPADACADDLEIADLGLCIPRELVDDEAISAVAANLPDGGTNGPLNRVRYAWTGPRQAEEVLGDLIVPRAWFFSLRGNKYSLFALSELLTEDDVDVQLGTSDIGVDDGTRVYVPEIDLRPVPPIDRITIGYGFKAGDNTLGATLADVARDPGVRARAGNHELDQRGVGLVDLSLWAKTGEAPNWVPSWIASWRMLWGWQMALWAASPLMMLKDLSIAPPRSLELQVGSVVQLSNPWPPSTQGTYGLTNVLGRVVRRRLEPSTLRAHVDILVQPGDISQLRRFAPAAMVVDDTDVLEERYNTGTLTFSCYGDYFGCGDGRSDVAAFVEPDGGVLGGNALIYGWQYNGRVWAKTFEAEVASVDTVAHTITLAAPLTGTFYNRMRTLLVMAPYDSQTAAWVRARFLVVTKANGKFGGSDMQGWKLL